MTHELKTRRGFKVAKEGSFEVRRETYDGREHIVVPVIALVEGVVFASNAENPEFVPAEELTSPNVVMGWNGRPVYSGHPQNAEGTYVSGNEPEVLEGKRIGLVFNASRTETKLKLEAWLDVERVKEIEPKLLERIEAGDDDIEVSVGVFVMTENEKGTFDGKKYDGRWTDIVPDHLAILPLGQTGACSVKAGCGVRAAQSKETTMKSNTKARTLASLIRTLVSTEEMSDNDVRRKLYQALVESVGRSCGFVEAVYDNLVVYGVFDETTYEMTMYRREYSLNVDGVVTLGAETTEVEPRLVYDEVPQGGAMKAAESHSCSCQTKANNGTEEKRLMNISAELQAKLEGASADQITAIEAVFAPAAVVETPAVEAVVETPIASAQETAPAAEAQAAPVVETPATTTIEQLLAAAPAAVKAEYEAAAARVAAHKTATIKALRDSGRCDMTDAELSGKTQTELDVLVKLAGVNAAAPAAEVDHSLAGASAARVAEENQKAPAPPDMFAVIRAAQGKK